jgi:hypothetical protein
VPLVIPLRADGRPRSKRAALGPPGYDPAFGARVLVLGPRPVPEELLFRTGITGQPTPIPTGVTLGRYWSDGDATEIVVLPQDVTGWVGAQLPAVEAWACRWCGEPLAAPVRSCPFCAHTLG